jgi:hypothetical protein
MNLRTRNGVDGRVVPALHRATCRAMSCGRTPVIHSRGPSFASVEGRHAASADVAPAARNER